MKRTGSVHTWRHAIVRCSVTSQTGVAVVWKAGNGGGGVHCSAAYFMRLGGQITSNRHRHAGTHALTGTWSQSVTVWLGDAGAVGAITAPRLCLELDARVG